MAIDVPGGILKQTDVRETITNTEETSIAWNPAYARYEGKFDVAAHGLYINPEGTELYILTAGDDVVQYTLSTRWDITTATLTHTLDISAKETAARGISFKPDGLKMYISGSNGLSVDEYNLSTAWAISTAVYSQEFDISAKITDETGFYMREDGKQFHVSGESSDKIYAYHMSTPWDITTSEFVDELSFTDPQGIFFSRDGVYVFVGKPDDKVYRYAMTSVFRISTASADTSFIVFPSTANLISTFFNTNGTRMYVLTNDKIQQYSIKRGWR